MAALVHIAAGFSTKPLLRKVPVWALIVAAEILDVFAILFGFVGIERPGSYPLTHGLVMSLAWSVALGALSLLIFRSCRAGFFIGGLVFSHWVIDFITHPMGAVFNGKPMEPDLPLLFGGSRNVGLGLYNYSIVVAYAVEYASIAVGLAVYVLHTIRQRRLRKAGGAAGGRK